MLARLARELHADTPTILEVAERLTPPQRSGLSPLPSPLPLVPTITDAFDELILSDRDRDLLLALSVSLDDGLDPLIDFDGRPAVEIAAAPVGQHLIVRAGRVRFVDRRLAVWIRAGAASAVACAVHDRLSSVYRAREDRVRADWHRARASLERDPDAAAELTRIARELSEAGHPDRALLLAREAARHAQGESRDEALLVAGASSVGAGLAVEAAGWLGGLFPDGTEHYRMQGLAGLLAVRAHTQGAVPDVDPALLRPTSDDHDDWYSWTRAAALAAVLCAERSDRRGMRVWLEAVREGAARVGVEQELRDPVVALSWLLSGERDLDHVSGSGPISGRMLRGLRAAIDGDIDLGLRVLGAAGASMDTEGDPLVAGFEQSPVVRAYLAVVEALLLVWRGDLGLARDKLRLSAVELPITMPFAGLGVVLARRLDLAVLGELSLLSAALTAALPAALKIDLLVDRAIQAYLAGAFDDASTSVRLWQEMGGPQTTLAVPGLDEVAPTNPLGMAAAASVAPPEEFVVQELCTRIATSTDRRWRTDREEIQAAARTMRSSFSRARVETMLGVQCAIRDEPAAAHCHLRSAQRLFELSGATAWARSVHDRLARLAERDENGGGAVDPLSACRHAWSQLLTAREVEVAMLAVAGAANRDIAAALEVSVRTVEVHLGRVFAKLDVRRRVELTALAHRTNRHL